MAGRKVQQKKGRRGALGGLARSRSADYSAGVGVAGVAAADAALRAGAVRLVVVFGAALGAVTLALEASALGAAALTGVDLGAGAFADIF